MKQRRNETIKMPKCNTFDYILKKVKRLGWERSPSLLNSTLNNNVCGYHLNHTVSIGAL